MFRLRCLAVWFGLVVAGTSQAMASSNAERHLGTALVVESPSGPVAFWGNMRMHFAPRTLVLSIGQEQTRITMAGARKVRAEVLQPSGLFSRYSGSDVRQQRIFQAVKYAGVYEGIDLVFSVEPGTFKSEWEIRPGGHVSSISMRYSRRVMSSR